MMDMSHASVVADLARRAPDLEILVSAASTATVDEAAATLGVEPGRIAKTIAIRVAGAVLLLVTRGDARIDNAKCKAAFGGRPRMLGADEVLALTGHPVGGVCPFGLATPLPVWLDRSLLAFDAVYPAAGSLTSSVRITPHRLAEVTAGRWTDACCLPAPSQLD
jgi:prolyl-tRNA editing enzyme YbaK/EbsC (Cys-tRNA(Pro) deacylase)